MTTLIDRLKQKARALHLAAEGGDVDAIARIHAKNREKPTTILRRHALATIAREAGFEGWPHLTAILTGERSDDFGTLLYPRGPSGISNIWSASYEEAAAIRKEHGGYLLPYKTQFLIADHFFIETLGLDPEDPAWTEMGRDWARPHSIDARARLYEKLLLP